MQCQTSSLIRDDQLDSIKQLQGKSCTVVGLVPARLFFSGTREKGTKEMPGWIYSGLTGALCLTIDRKIHAWVLRLFEVEGQLMELFECELYANLQDSLHRLTPTFLAFQYIDGFIGIQFIQESDADLMMKVLKRSCERMDQEEKQDFIARLETSQAAELGVKQTAPKKKKDAGKKKKSGFGGWLKKVFGGKKKKDEDDGPKMGETDQSKYEISMPRGFEKTSHIGWDPSKNTFIMNQVPDDVKSLLRRHKIKKKYLKDKKLAPEIFNILTNPNAIRDSNIFLMQQNMQQESMHKKDINNPFLSPEINSIQVEDKGRIVGEVKQAVPEISAKPQVDSKQEVKQGSAIPAMTQSSVIPPPSGSSMLVPPPPPPPPPPDTSTALTLIQQLKMLKKPKAQRNQKLDLKKITAQEENTLMSNLQNMIMQRRSAIEKSEFESDKESSESDDWSDEDFD